MTDPRSHPTVRGWSLLLSSLTLTPDAGLEAYRARRAGDPALDLEQLTRARGILDAVAQAIASKDRARWQRLDRAFAVLERDTVVSLTEPTAAVDSPPKNPVPTSAPEPAVMPVAAMPVAAMPVAPAMAAAGLASAAVPATTAAPSPWSVAVLASAGAPVPMLVPPPVGTVEAPPLPQSIDETALGEWPALGPLLPFVAAAGAAASTVTDRSGLPTVLPFKPARTIAPPSLTVQQLAAVAVDLELDPASAEAIRARYGLDEEHAKLAFAALEASCRSDSQVYAEWQHACAIYRAHRLGRQ